MEDIAATRFSPFEPDAPRILLTGSPIGKGSEKVLRMIEECGGGGGLHGELHRRKGPGFAG